MVVGLGRLGPPFVDRPALACGDDVGFRVGDVLGKEPVLLGLLAEERQRPVVAGDSGKAAPDSAVCLAATISGPAVFRDRSWRSTYGIWPK